MVKSITTVAQFQAELAAAGNKLIVVDFTATWCGPCRQIAPQYEALAKQYKDVVFLKVDINQGQELSAMYQIRSVPTFYFFKGGATVSVVAGADIATVTMRIQQFK